MNKIQNLLPRYLTRNITEALEVFPVVILTGARQTGKSTLIRELLPAHNREYRTLDDLDVLERAQQEPEGLVASRHPLTIDEIQRSPELLSAIKRAVDRQRRPGQFLLSGSANLTLMRQVSETLAGRAMYLTLHPLTVAERAGFGTAGWWEQLFENPAELEGRYSSFSQLSQVLLESGFPPAVFARRSADRDAWLDGYTRTYLERDLQALTSISNLVDFRRLMRMAARRSGSIVNQSEMARDGGFSQPTTQRYLVSERKLNLPYLARVFSPFGG